MTLLLSGCNGESQYALDNVLSEARTAIEAREYLQAAAWLERVEPDQPQPKSYYLLKGITYFKLRDLERAVAAFKASKPESVPLLVDLAYLYLFLGELEEAKALAAQVSSRYPSHPEWFILIGNIRLRERRYMAAREVFEQALAVPGDRVRAYVGLANTAFFERDFVQAEEQFYSAIFHSPGSLYAYVALSKYYLAMKRYDDAEATLRLVLAQNVENINVVILLSNVLITSGQYGQALALLKRYESNIPYSRVVKSQIIRCLFFLKRYEEAYQIIKSVGDHQYRDDMLLLTGEYYLRTNQVEFALDDFHSAVASRDDYLENYYLGLAYLLKQDDGLALKYLDDAARHRPQFLRAHLLLAALYIEKREYSSALKRCNWVIRLDPKNLEAHLLRGLTMYLQHRLTESAAVFELVLRWAPAHPAPPLFLALISQRQPSGEASQRPAEFMAQIQSTYIERLFLGLRGGNTSSEALWTSYLEQYPNEQVALLIASYYQEHAQFDQAKSYLHRAIVFNETCAICYYKLAHISQLKGDLGSSTKYLEKSLDMDNKLLESYKALGVLYEKKREYLKAIHIYEKGLFHFPDDTTLLNNLAWLYLVELNDSNTSYIHIRRAVSIDKQDPDIRDTLAWWYVLNREEERAIRLLEPLVKADPTNATFRYHAGIAYLNSGRGQAGEENLRLALEYGVTGRSADHIRQVLQ